MLRIILSGNESADWWLSQLHPWSKLRCVGADQAELFCLYSSQIGNTWSAADAVKAEDCEAVKRCPHLRRTEIAAAAADFCAGPAAGWRFHVSNAIGPQGKRP